ncbi:hypothetical protein ACIOJE_34940 [Kitasatospora sp. NPDC087861]|uniref:MinD/ParA family ATP-binding protein n=1 Tax=Kitasatospora sp. NPDC087861 TaxID=3364070 RepID=UPI00382F1B86
MMGSRFQPPVGEEDEGALTAEVFNHAAQSRRNVSPRLVSLPVVEPKVEPEAPAPSPEPAGPDSGHQDAPVVEQPPPGETVDTDLVNDSVYVRTFAPPRGPAIPLPEPSFATGPVQPAAVAAFFPLPVHQSPLQSSTDEAPPGSAVAAASSATGGSSAAGPRNGAAGFDQLPPTSPPVPGFDVDSSHAAAEPSAPGAGSEAGSPARWGWRGQVRRLSGGLISPAASAAEAAYREEVALVQRTLRGPRTVVFVNPKGGASTTTSTLMAAHTLGVHRAGGVLAWDNNETRGTLGGRAMRAGHANTARELLANIGQFEDPERARVDDLGLYLRGQGDGRFDVLASDDRPEVTGHIAADDVARLHRLFSRYYQLILIDTGNNMRAANWMRAVQAADLLVVTTTVRIDAANSALWMLDALERHVFGAGQLRQRTVTVLTEPASTRDHKLRSAMESIFGARTRAVAHIPFDPALVDGGEIDHDKISDRTHQAWLHACAEMSRALL